MSCVLFPYEVWVLTLPSTPSWPLTAWTLSQDNSFPCEVASVRYVATRWRQEVAPSHQISNRIHSLPVSLSLSMIPSRRFESQAYCILQGSTESVYFMMQTPRHEAFQRVLSTDWYWSALLTINSDSGCCVEDASTPGQTSQLAACCYI